MNTSIIRETADRRSAQQEHLVKARSHIDALKTIIAGTQDETQREALVAALDAYTAVSRAEYQQIVGKVPEAM